jgi:hypothetical protein
MRAVPAASLERETRQLIKGLLSRGAAALGAARDVLRRSRREALLTTLPHAEDAYRRLAGDPDLARAVQDFKTRSRPLSS